MACENLDAVELRTLWEDANGYNIPAAWKELRDYLETHALEIAAALEELAGLRDLEAYYRNCRQGLAACGYSADHILMRLDVARASDKETGDES